MRQKSRSIFSQSFSIIFFKFHAQAAIRASPIFWLLHLAGGNGNIEILPAPANRTWQLVGANAARGLLASRFFVP
jgi:hypothetical protein